MSNLDSFKFETKRDNLFLRVTKGHFATDNRHSNYYIDVSAQKSRLSEARAVAEELCSNFYHSTIVDTILCLDGTEIIGACLAEELTKGDFVNLNLHKTIYITAPEFVNGKIMFRDNIKTMIEGKNVLILGVSIASGRTFENVVNAVNYYGGKVSCISAIFSLKEECCGLPVYSVFDPKNLPDYENHPSHECPMCKAGQKIDALINGFGYSKI